MKKAKKPTFPHHIHHPPTHPPRLLTASLWSSHTCPALQTTSPGWGEGEGGGGGGGGRGAKHHNTFPLSQPKKLSYVIPCTVIPRLITIRCDLGRRKRSCMGECPLACLPSSLFLEGVYMAGLADGLADLDLPTLQQPLLWCFLAVSWTARLAGIR